MSSTRYPFPSHVSVQSFVTVKLSDKSMYRLWKTQMLRLLESHGMLDFINESAPVMLDGDEWNRWDALVHGWILGSLSEQAAIAVLNSLESKLHQQTHFTAKHIWNQVRSLYGQQAAEQEEERKGGGCCGSLCIDKVKEERDILRNKQMLYDAVECGKLQQVVSILKNGKVGITDSISINGNTALHIAVAYRDGWFLKSMLDLTGDISLTEVQNLDGSTPLHVAASLGKANVAKILLDRSPDLLHVKDNQGCTPLNIILSQPLNKNMCLLFMNFALPDIEQADAEPFVVNAISYGHFDLALAFIQKCNSWNTHVVLMAIAQNCPAHFTPNQLLIYELLRTPVIHLITRGTSDMKGCMKLANLVLKAVLAYPYKMLIQICIKLRVYKDLEKSMKERGDARDLMDFVCAIIRCSNESSSYRDFYTEAMFEAIRRDASDVVEIILNWFPEAALIMDEDGHNFAQAVWKNRASKIYALILDGNLAKHMSLSQESLKEDDNCGNNFLHFAARLGPSKNLDLILSPLFRMQRELQWFKAAKEIIPHSQQTRKNCLGETPEMVFTKEHKDMETECRGWITRTAKLVIIVATLLVTVMFTASIQVPGGNDEKGLPNLISKPAFVLFEIWITIAMATSSLSLLLFFIVLTAPLTHEDFLYRVPLAMIIGSVSLFMTQVLSMLAFGAWLYILFGNKDPWILGLVTSLIVLPMSLFFLSSFWFVSNAFRKTIDSTCHFLMIHAFRRLNLVGRIFI